MANIDELPERFRSKVDPVTGCWLWTGYQDRSGYGRTFSERQTGVVAHRVIYELLVGSVPEGLELDHLCRHRNCVNPDHLEPVTHTENVRRGEYPNASKTHCPQGHRYSVENTYVYRGNRACRTCRTAAVQAWRHRTREG